jgi:hypothetical protein
MLNRVGAEAGNKDYSVEQRAQLAISSLLDIGTDMRIF